jgi:hypothetical protein
MPRRPERPADADYYERDRVELFSQGDLFRDVPLAYPSPAEELVVDEEQGGGSRRFLSGPLTFGPARLITPSCSMGAQGTAGYGHPVRTLVPLLPLAALVEGGVVKNTALDDLRRFDHLINYMYMPPLEVDELELSMKRRKAVSRSLQLDSKEVHRSMKCVPTAAGVEWPTSVRWRCGPVPPRPATGSTRRESLVALPTSRGPEEPFAGSIPAASINPPFAGTS